MLHQRDMLLRILLMISPCYPLIRYLDVFIYFYNTHEYVWHFCWLYYCRCLSLCNLILVWSINRIEETTAGRETPDSCSVAPSPMVLILIFNYLYFKIKKREEEQIELKRWLHHIWFILTDFYFSLTVLFLYFLLDFIFIFCVVFFFLLYWYTWNSTSLQYDLFPNLQNTCWKSLSHSNTFILSFSLSLHQVNIIVHSRCYFVSKSLQTKQKKLWSWYLLIRHRKPVWTVKQIAKRVNKAATRIGSLLIPCPVCRFWTGFDRHSLKIKNNFIHRYKQIIKGKLTSYIPTIVELWYKQTNKQKKKSRWILIRFLFSSPSESKKKKEKEEKSIFIRVLL